MGQKQEVLNIYLQEILFTEIEIVKTVENREHIFEMKNEDGVKLGFISMYNLKAYIFEHDKKVIGFHVRNIDQKTWTAIFEHPFFQRRKPQLVAASNLVPEEDQQFFILDQGQKTGPYERDQLIAMLEEKKLLLTDMISNNGGQTWIKLHQVENFDRRVLKESNQLPGLPSDEILENGEEAVARKPETEAISSLAYLSNVKRGKNIEREKNETFYADEALKKGRNSIFKWLLLASILGIGYFLFHIMHQLNSPFKTEAPALGEQSQMLTPVEMPGRKNPIPQHQNVGQQNSFNQINDQGRSEHNKFEQRVMQPIRPNSKKSFMESAQYQEIKNEAPPEEDPNYYYDNTSAMELDPVRSQVSKENYEQPLQMDDQQQGNGLIPTSENTFENEPLNQQ